MEKLKNFFLGHLTGECAIDFENNKLLEITCGGPSLTKIIGYILIVISVFMKIPQIRKIYSKKSAKGLNVLSLLLELFNSTGHAAYCLDNKFSFSEWGDSLFIGLQTMIVAALSFYYEFSVPTSFGFVLIYGSLTYVLVSGLTPSPYLFLVESSLIPILVVGKVLQIRTNYKAQSTAQLSLFSWLMLFISSILRVYTSFLETGDYLVVATYVLSTVLNGIVVAQFVLYRKAHDKDEKHTSKTNKTKTQ